MKRLSLALFGLLLWSTAAAACAGDCGNHNAVSAADIATAVEIALGRATLVVCEDADAGMDGDVTIDDLVAATLASIHGCPTATVTVARSATPTPTVAGVEPVFPADYRATFTEVRDCRSSIEHGGVNIRVLVNPIAVDPYLSEVNPLPRGSIVVKEEFSGPDCKDADLVRWRAMRKEAEGFDPQDADWHWQWVNPDRSVLLDDKSTCIGCHVRPACTARDYMCTEEGTTLNPVLQNLPGALLSVSGTDPSNVFAVGADPVQDANGPQVLHYDGSTWQPLNTHASGDLWWVSVAPIDGSFYMAGDGGLVLRVENGSNIVSRMDTPTSALLYGVWGATGSDLWAVGGDVSDVGVVLRYDGQSWKQQDLSGVVAGGLPTLFKVWGRSATDVYASGLRGTVIHFDGAHWTQIPSNSLRSLFTVNGDATRTYAVGGFIDGAILELAQGAAAFQDVTPSGLPQMNGIFAPPVGLPAAVGRELSMARRTAAGWQLRQRSEGSIYDFHATWIDPEGGVWAVGGDLTELTKGLLQYAGQRTISSTIEQPPRCPTGAAGPGGTVSYSNDVVPLLQQSGCLNRSCHGSALASSGYDQRTYASSFKQGVEALALDVCPIVPGDAAASFLVEKIQAAPRLGARMPSNLPALSQTQIDLIRTWVMEGARNN